MELIRNVEVVLMLSFGLLCAAACVVQPAARPIRQAAAQPPPARTMPVVVITGKRLSAEQKRALAS